eukprot:9201678-Alexandrium_andersonii.AAC.1
MVMHAYACVWSVAVHCKHKAAQSEVVACHSTNDSSEAIGRPPTFSEAIHTQTAVFVPPGPTLGSREEATHCVPLRVLN